MNNLFPKLSPHLFDKEVEKVPIRKGFGEGLLIAGQNDKNVVGLCADLTESTQMHLFKEKFPERFVEIGVAEQNLATVASGMASMGKIPFITSYAVFSPGRNWEQIRTTICYNNQPVKIVGSHAGISVGPDGGSHQALEDIAITRVLPNMVVISPCDAIEARKATIAMAKTKNPTYIRLAREKTPIITTEHTPFEIGKAQIVFQGNKVTSNTKKLTKSVAIIATGSLVYNAILAGKELTDKGVDVTVMNLATIKPLDEHAIIKLAHEYKAIVTVEEHQIAGGMGSAVAELLSAHFPVPMEFIGVKDMFGQSGTPDELLESYNMDVKDIVGACNRVILRK
jgi:transketolase